MTNEKQVGIYVKTLKNRLIKLEKRNKQLLTALRSAKRIIKILHDEIESGITWINFQNLPQMKQINKAIKDGKI